MITDERKKYIRNLSNDEWGDGLNLSERVMKSRSRKMQDETHAFCQTAEDANELHYFVSTYNWDKGYVHMREVMDNPHCDAGTALMMYWKAGPEFYLQFVSRSEVPSFNTSGYDFVTRLEEKYINSRFSSNTIKFNPSDCFVDYNVDERKKWARSLPKIMSKPSSLKPKNHQKILRPSWKVRVIMTLKNLLRKPSE